MARRPRKSMFNVEVEEAVIEEPVIEEPVIEEPVIEEPRAAPVTAGNGITAPRPGQTRAEFRKANRHRRA